MDFGLRAIVPKKIAFKARGADIAEIFATIANRDSKNPPRGGAS
jgi:hypothetical protein